jgi:hypothetical protein
MLDGVPMSLFRRSYPFFRRTALRVQVDKEVQSRIGALLAMSADLLFALPASRAESAQISGNAVAVTVLREALPDGSQVIAVRAAPGVNSIAARRGAIQGFLLTQDGARSWIPDEILRIYV